jgi:hypothetical protein
MQLELSEIIAIVKHAMPETRRHNRPSPIAVGTYCVIRCRDAGVHAGEYVSHHGREVVLKNSRRIWQFVGAQTLSEVAFYGAKPASKIAPVLPLIVLGDACEIIPCSAIGEAFIRGAAEYKC